MMFGQSLSLIGRYIPFSLILFLSCAYPAETSMVYQQPIENLYDHGMLAFKQQRYYTAQHQLSAYLGSHRTKLNQGTAAYHLLLSCIANNDPSLEYALRYYTFTYPFSRYHEDTKYYLANLLFQKGEFQESCLLYERIDVDKLILPEAESYFYNCGMAYLHLEEFHQARACFEYIQNTEHKQYYPSKLQIAFIAYKEQNYQDALDLLQEIEDHGGDCLRLAQNLRLKIYYNTKQFSTLLDYVNQHSVQIDGQTDRENVLLVGDALFFSKRYEESIHYYDTFLDGSNDMERDVVSKLAYALYITKEYDQALYRFQQLLDQNDAYSQLANYYIGLILLASDDSQRAVQYFDTAQTQCHDLNIYALSLIQNARLLYKNNQFQSAIDGLRKLISQYPQNDHLLEAQALLAQAYCKIGEYQLAIGLLEDIPSKDDMLSELYQFALFCQGLHYYNCGSADEALPFFTKALDYSINTALLLQVKFGLAESLAALKEYSRALPLYKAVIEQGGTGHMYHLNALYGIGYVYFHLNDYGKAIKFFQEYTRLTQSQRATTYYDALLRLGDCHYVRQDYKQALKAYDKAYDYNPPHVCYYKAWIYDALGDHTNKKRCIDIILKQYKKTPYYIACLYDDACFVFSKGNYQTAIKKFTSLINYDVTHDFMPSCLLKRALAYENIKEKQRAVADYTRILEEYPSSEETKSALIALSQIFNAEGHPDKIKPYLNKHSKLSNSATETHLEGELLDRAKTLFYKQDYKQVLQQLESFVGQFSNSPLHQEAHFYIAESYFRLKDFGKAIHFYKKVIDHKNNQQPLLYSKSSLRIADIYYNDGNWKSALTYYKQVQGLPISTKESIRSLLGIARTSFELANYDMTTSSCLKLVDMEKDLPAEVLQETYFLLGKTSLKRCAYNQAKRNFTKAKNLVVSAQGQEAQYLLAFSEFKLKDYRASLDTLFKLTDLSNRPAYGGRAKAFLLMVDNYLALGQLEQAKVTVDSIIAQAKDKHVIGLAKKKRALILAKQKAAQRKSDKAINSSPK